jgi:hypothetical protein
VNIFTSFACAHFRIICHRMASLHLADAPKTVLEVVLLYEG